MGENDGERGGILTKQVESVYVEMRHSMHPIHDNSQQEVIMLKKIIAFVLMVMILLMSAVPVLALQEETLILFIDGKQVTYKAPPVTLILNGKVVETDVPPVILGNRTLVPVRVISESTGARVEWDGENYEVAITTGDKVIKLKINSDEMLINGESLTLDVPAKIINDRTMVPVRAISESLGLEVGWEASTYSVLLDYPKADILNISYSSEEEAVLLKTTGRVMYNTMFLQEPDRLVIDFPNTVFRSLVNSIDINNGNIMRVRASQFEVDPNTSRVVIDLEEPSGYSIAYNEETKQLKIRTVNGIKQISFDDNDGRDKVVIDSTSRLEYQTMVLEQPDRIVVDLHDTYLNEIKNGSIPIDKKSIKAVRYSQFEDNIVRVVIDLDIPLQYNIENDQDGVIIYLDGSPVDEVKYAEIEWKKALLSINTGKQVSYNVICDNNSKTLLVEVPGDKADLEEGTVYIDDGIVERIETVPYSASRGASYVVLYLKDGIKYNIISPEKTDNIELELSGIPALYQNMLIAIDPGHGGEDPGGMGKSGLKEKDLNLDISFRLKALLEDIGFKVFMTRTEDCFVDLYKRAEVVNEANADLFVSVHVNAHPSTSMYGVETLYYPSSKNKEDNRENYAFAKMIQEEMIKELKTADRGLDPREKLVVTRETKMPAVIAELGFLTNKNEEALFMQDDYHQKCAVALANGIKRYVDEVLIKEED